MGNIKNFNRYNADQRKAKLYRMLEEFEIKRAEIDVKVKMIQRQIDDIDFELRMDQA